MFYDLFNASATFLGYVNKIMAEKLDIFIIVYLDDILIYTKDLASYTLRLYTVFKTNSENIPFLPT